MLEDVDRELTEIVALRMESVDRNNAADALLKGSAVALRKESVDRNLRATADGKIEFASLSARRAWIEIPNRMATGDGARSRSPQGERG